MGLSLCAGRLLQLQGFESSSYPADALLRTLPLLPARGEITDRNGQVLASTQPAVAVTADPTLTGERAAEVAEIVSRHLGMTTTELMPLLTKPGTHFVYLKKQVPALTYSALAAELSARKIYGVFREADPIRTYPGKTVGSSVVGFVGADGQGLAGLELKFNTELAGVEGEQTFESAPNGSRIPLGDSSLKPARNGMNYQLTLDSEVQWAAERRLAAGGRADQAPTRRSPSCWTSRPASCWPWPTRRASTANQPQRSDAENRGNRAVSGPVRAGQCAEGADRGRADRLRHRDAGDQGRGARSKLKSGDRYIKDAFTHEAPILKLNLRGIIARSSNIGTALLARQMSKQTLHDYLLSFGLGLATGIELPGESGGILAEPGHDRRRPARPDRVRPGPGGDRDPAGRRHRRHRQRRGLPPADGDQGRHRRRGPRGAGRPPAAPPGDLRRELGPGPRPDGGGGRQRERSEGASSWTTTRSGGKTGTAQRADTDVPCYQRLRHLLRRRSPRWTTRRS